MSLALRGLFMALTLAVIAACGRVGYAPAFDGSASPRDATGDGSAASPDGSSTDGATPCAATETCNGVDDDCDGEVDEGCSCTEFTIVVADSTTDGWVDWTGDGYGVAWVGVVGTSRDVYFRTFDAAGVPRDAPRALTASGQVLSVRGLAWNGGVHGLLFTEDDGPGRSRTSFATIDGAVVSDVLVGAPDGVTDAALVSTAWGWAVASVTATRVDLTRIEAGASTSQTVGTLGDTALGVAFGADADGAMIVARSVAGVLRLPFDATLRTPGSPLTSPTPANAVLLVRAATPARWLLGLERGSELETQSLDADGVVVGASTEPIDVSGSGDLVRAGGVAVYGRQDAVSMRASTTPIDADTGAALDGPVLSGSANRFGFPVLAGASRRVGILWRAATSLELIQRCL